ncbi:MAG: hypothetical protein HY047_19990, partial [Acidobacteria bacterium]|nr:hypothetical protein [Acidobacteriota bacterium]
DRVAPWCARALRQITLGDTTMVNAPPKATAGCAMVQPPNHTEPFGGAVGDTVRSWFVRPRWSVGLLPCRVEEVLHLGRLPTPTWLAGQPADRFFADPFLLDVQGDEVRLLVEDYRYSSRAKGVSELRMRMDGTLLDHRVLPGLPLHASYPFLLRDKGALFCLPETHRARRVSAFVRDQASGSWKAHRDVMSGFPFVDSTLLEHDGKWWLFCTKQGDEDQSDLYVFHADAWIGPWAPHVLNPVKSDTRSSRPAGACFRIGGAIYRPAQNCARRYGAGITINRLVYLSPNRFHEEPVLSLAPPPGIAWPDGVHTINSLGGVTVIDGLRVERRWGPAAWARPRYKSHGPTDHAATSWVSTS